MFYHTGADNGYQDKSQRQSNKQNGLRAETLKNFIFFRLIDLKKQLSELSIIPRK